MSKRNRRGFTLVEVVVALVLGLVVLSAALSFVVTTYRSTGGNEVREEVYRNARFIGMSLQRDLQVVGTGIASTTPFGTLATWSDTIAILRLPYTPAEAPTHNLVPPGGSGNPLPAGGTCGTYCIDVKTGGGTFDLQPGDLARLQVKAETRLILVQSVKDNGSSMAITFTAAPDSLLHIAAGLSGGLLLDRFSTYVQKLAPIVYWVENNKLMRAERLNLNGTLNGDVMAYNVQSLKDSLVFFDGHVAAKGDPTGTDPNSGFDDVVGIRIQTSLSADRPDPRVNSGVLFTRSYKWRFAPRNLMWQRNRF